METMYDKDGREAFAAGMPVGGRPVPMGYAQHEQGYGTQSVAPVNCDEMMHITTAADLQQYSQGTVVRFPDFAEGQPFVARVRRPSMLALAKQGRIPNALMNTASELFAKGGSGLDTDDKNMLSNFYDTCKIICEATLMQPTMAEIESAGMTLSDDQIMAIFNYTQTGVKALQPFRKK